VIGTIAHPKMALARRLRTNIAAAMVRRVLATGPHDTGNLKMALQRFRGSIPALITTFASDGSFDEKAFRAFVEWQIAEGSHGLVPVGTTGESPTLSHDEHKRVVEVTVEVARGRVPVIAGAGSNNTAEAVDLARHAQKAGADAVLVVTPYYNKPNQRGMIAHFSAVAEAINIPLFIYNIPGRSIIDMLPETMAKLHKSHKNIVGVKDATANLSRASEQRHACGKDFIQLSGEDITALGFNAHGGVGCISVTANVAPRLCSQFQEHCLAGRFDEALKIQDKLTPLHKAMFHEPSPGGAKYALSLLGHAGETTRSPLVPLEQSTKAMIRDAMVHAGLIN
jgi:4-hydroxy-tetrahydrodipicolinate synthase